MQIKIYITWVQETPRPDQSVVRRMVSNGIINNNTLQCLIIYYCGVDDSPLLLHTQKYNGTDCSYLCTSQRLQQAQLNIFYQFFICSVIIFVSLWWTCQTKVKLAVSIRNCTYVPIWCVIQYIKMKERSPTCVWRSLISLLQAGMCSLHFSRTIFKVLKCVK